MKKPSYCNRSNFENACMLARVSSDNYDMTNYSNYCSMCGFNNKNCSICGFNNKKGNMKKPEWCISNINCSRWEYIQNYKLKCVQEKCNSFIDKELVAHPDHYGGKDNFFEVIKIIDHYKLNFNLGNVLKYILRAGKKDNMDEITDFEKALFYLNRELESKKNK